MQTTIAGPVANVADAFAPANSENGNAHRKLIEAMVNSKLYREYEAAFMELTGLPVALQPVETWQLPHHGQRMENPFCALIAQKSSACAGCLLVQEQLAKKAADGVQTITCPSGLCDTAIPVHLGETLIGYLHTGQLFRKKPNDAQFERVLKLTAGWGLEADRETIRKAYFAGKVVPAKQHQSVTKLLTIFAQHLSSLSNQIAIQQKSAEPLVITKAREYIWEHQSEELSLGRVAKAVNTSTFYFCKMFRKVTGVNFTNYVSRVRIEKAKNLLLNPNLRVSEIAFEVGFQSLTHFNRVFKKSLGQSPTAYRAHLVNN